MIDGILTLGHFCETHGPCVILCTQRYEEEPRRTPQNLNISWCEACQSIDSKQLLICRDITGYYVTSRSPLQQELAFLLKQAVVRSLSCEEETSKNGSTMYFGDNDRGHVLSHTFALQDSLARGFYRKYCLIVLMKDKVYLLNAWHILMKHIKEVVEDLQKHARTVNGTEQEIQSQRAFRQAQTSPSPSTRSLSQLTGQPAIFAHIHLWFCCILNIKVASEKLKLPAEDVLNLKAYSLLRAIFQDMTEDTFNKALYCCLTGVNVECESSVLNSLKAMLPNNWPVIASDDKCEIYKISNKWVINWSGQLPVKLPTFHTQCVKALKDYRLSDKALDLQLQALIYQWHNVVKTLCQCPSYNKNLLQAMGVQTCDLPLLVYWICHCIELPQRCKIVIDNLKRALMKQ